MHFEAPRIENFPQTLLVGLRTRMSLNKNTTRELWRRFMPSRHKIQEARGVDLYSVEVYDDNTYFSNFDPEKTFEKWAAIAVNTPSESYPEGMEELEIKGGVYAVFTYRGHPDEAYKMYQYIFGEWMPKSNYTIDTRAHFAVMGAKYKTNDPNSEEELWIPVTAK